MLNLIRKDYPEMSSNDLKLIDAFIWNKCSEYYFIDYLRCTNGNALDSIEFYKFDEDLRAILTNFIIRFEIQLKTDFVKKLYVTTNSEHFFKDKSFYLKSALSRNNKFSESTFEFIVAKIENEYKRYKFKTPGPLNYVALSFCSFGSFQSLFKFINISYKKEFINMYTRNLPRHDFKILNMYISAIRMIRNRCAHGNHVVTLKMKNQLEKLSFITKTENLYIDLKIKVFEAVLIFLLNHLECSNEYEERMSKLINKYKKLITKYYGFHVFSYNIFKIFNIID